MVVRFNFATEQSVVPDGYTLDFGEAYSTQQGYGWVQESDLSTPLDITPNGRDRDLVEDQLIDTLIHLQYPEVGEAPDAVRTPAAWQYDLPNGDYLVTVSVGDAEFTDSTHNVNVEGVNVIDDFTPTAENQFTTASEVITVDDGQLTVDGIGGENTKLNYLDIAPLIDVRVNFAPEDFAGTSEDDINDLGQAYSEERGYGWISEDSVGTANSTPLDLTGNTRARGLSDDGLLDTLIHLQYPDYAEDPNTNRTPAAWEYDLLNGSYEVRVSVGDSAFVDSRHTINIEGVSTISEFTPGSGDSLFRSASNVVEVTDGKLTIDAIGGENTKLNFVEIVSVEVAED